MANYPLVNGKDTHNPSEEIKTTQKAIKKERANQSSNFPDFPHLRLGSTNPRSIWAQTSPPYSVPDPSNSFDLLSQITPFFYVHVRGLSMYIPKNAVGHLGDQGRLGYPCAKYSTNFL
jgi:hypothetical protein